MGAGPGGQRDSKKVRSGMEERLTLAAAGTAKKKAAKKKVAKKNVAKK